MRIGIVGGMERSESAYREVAELAGHTLAYHSGHMQWHRSDIDPGSIPRKGPPEPHGRAA